MTDNNTRRYPRTMQEAFGPYTSHQLHNPRLAPEQPQAKMPLADKIVLGACLAGLLMLLVAVALDWLPGAAL
jgi:hypothetical protein